MSKKNSKQAFISAVKARGGLKHYDLGGSVTGAANSVSLGPTGLGGNAGGGFGQQVGGTDIHGGPQGSQSQGGLIGAITPQNQYSAMLAPISNADYTGTITAASQNALAGYGQSQGNIAQQQALEQQFLAQGQGQGPNPAQAALNNATGANVANQAALAASQRGASQNVGLMQRNIAQQGAATQQQAAGQGAVMQAQQELAGRQAAAQQQAAIGNAINNQTAVNNQLFATAAGAENTENANKIANYGQMQGINSAVSQGNTSTTSSMLGGLAGGMGSAMSSLFADGGEVKEPEPSPTPDSSQQLPGSDEERKKVQDSFNHALGFADGGGVGQSAPMPNMAQSFAGRLLSGSLDPQYKSGSTTGPKAASNTPTTSAPMKADSTEDLPATGGNAESFDPSAPILAAKGGQMKKPVTTSQMAAKGMDVPGKAKVKGDSLKNDTVPAMLSPDEIVLPRSVTTSSDAPQRAARFVQAIQAKQGMKRKAKK